MTIKDLTYYTTIFLIGAILGATAMFCFRQNEIKPLLIFSNCLNEKTTYIDDIYPYISIDELQNCYEIYLTAKDN